MQQKAVASDWGCLHIAYCIIAGTADAMRSASNKDCARLALCTAALWLHEMATFSLRPPNPDEANSYRAVFAGHVRVADLTTGKEDFIAAHESPLSYIAINHDGSRIATASEKVSLSGWY